MLYRFLLLTLFALGSTVQAQQLDIVQPRNEIVPQWTTDQFTTFAVTYAVGSIVRTKVEDWTDSKAWGVVAGTISRSRLRLC